jgi:Cadherin-like
MSNQSPSLQEYVDATNAVASGTGPVTNPIDNDGSIELRPLLNQAGNPEYGEIDFDGFYAQAFVDENGDVIVAFKGSIINPFPLSQFLTPYGAGSRTDDIDILNGKLPTALVNDALSFVQSVREIAGSAPLYVTGHSLGGFEAEVVTAAAGSPVDGGVTFGAPGVPGYNGESSNLYAADLLDYVEEGDPVGNFADDPESGLAIFAATKKVGPHVGQVQLIGNPDQSIKAEEPSILFSPSWLRTLDLILGPLEQFHPFSTYWQDPAINKTPNGPIYPDYSTSTDLAELFAQSLTSSAEATTTPSSPGPIITNQSIVPATTNAVLYLANLFPPAESPASSTLFPVTFSITYITGPGEITIGGQSYGTGTTISNVSLAEFDAGYFSAGADTGVNEITVTAYDQDGTASSPASTAIEVAAPDNPQQVQQSNTTPPTIVPPMQSLVVGVGDSETISYNVLDATDSAGYSPGQLKYVITSALAGGWLVVNGSITSSFTQADINNGLLTYQQNGTDASNDSFSYYVTDPNGNQTSVTTVSIQIEAPPASTSPTLTIDSSLAVGQGSSAPLTASNLDVTDNGVSNSWQIVYTITSGPTNGKIVVGGSQPVTFFTQQELDIGLIQYLNTADASGPDSFTFTVSDGEGGTTGQNTFDINVVPRNNLSVDVERPLFTDPEGQFAITTDPSAPYLISTEGSTQFRSYTNTPGWVSLLSSDVLSAVDPGVSPSDITYTVVSMPANAGGLLIGQWGIPQQSNYVPFNGYTIAPVDITENFTHSFTQAEVDAGEVFYQQTNEIGSGQEHYGEQFSLVLSASDNAGNSLGDITIPIVLDQYGLLTNGTFIPRSQIPTVDFSAAIGETTTVGPALLTFISNQFADDQLVYSVFSMPTEGSLLLDGEPLSMNSTFTQQDIDDGAFAYKQNGTRQHPTHSAWMWPILIDQVKFRCRFTLM